MSITITSVHPFADAFPMMTADELYGLVADMDEHGQIEPCIVNSQGVLLDGRNRLEACRQLGVEPLVTRCDPESETAFIISLNVHRRHLNASQAGIIALEALPHFEAEARARQSEAGKYDRGKQLVAPVPQADGRAPLARDLAAQALGISGRTVAQAKRISEQAPELLEDIKVGNLTLKAAEKRLKQNLETVQWMRDERIGEADPVPSITPATDPDPLDLAFLEGAAQRFAKSKVTWAHDPGRNARAETAFATIATHMTRLQHENRRMQ